MLCWRAVTKPCRRRLLALTAFWIAMLGAMAAPAASLPTQGEPEAAQLDCLEPDTARLHARVGERAFERPVLSPGLHWVALPEVPPRLPAPVLVSPGGERADEHTLPGWCLAHSTSTALP
jgi:hypothetical protein